MTEKHKAEEWETEHHKAQQHKTEHQKAGKAEKTSEEMHTEVLDCINASQAGAVLERIEALKLKFPELQGAMQIPPPPPEILPEDGGARGTRHKK